MESTRRWPPPEEDVEINRVLLEFPLHTAEQVQLEVAARGYKVTLEQLQGWMQS